MSMRDGAPFCVSEFVSLQRYNDLTSAIHYTDKSPTDFVDRFHDVCQMIHAFNQHYADKYIQSWRSCLDESMISWLDKFCLGFMSIPRKPHPLGNEYHSIANGDDGNPVMWRINIQHGKDCPKDGTGKWAFPSKFEGTNAASSCKLARLLL